MDLVGIERLPRGPHPAPDMLSGSEVSRLIAHAPSLKHKALFMLMYGAGRKSCWAIGRCRARRAERT